MYYNTLTGQTVPNNSANDPNIIVIDPATLGYFEANHTKVVGSVTVNQPSTTYVNAYAISSVVGKITNGFMISSYVISTVSGYLIAIDANSVPASGATIAQNSIIVPWIINPGIACGGSYSDAPVSFQNGLILLASSSLNAYNPIDTTFIQAGVR